MAVSRGNCLGGLQTKDMRQKRNVKKEIVRLMVIAGANEAAIGCWEGSFWLLKYLKGFLFSDQLPLLAMSLHFARSANDLGLGKSKSQCPNITLDHRHRQLDPFCALEKKEVTIKKGIITLTKIEH